MHHIFRVCFLLVYFEMVVTSAEQSLNLARFLKGLRRSSTEEGCDDSVEDCIVTMTNENAVPKHSTRASQNDRERTTPRRLGEEKDENMAKSEFTRWLIFQSLACTPIVVIGALATCSIYCRERRRQQQLLQRHEKNEPKTVSPATTQAHRHFKAVYYAAECCPCCLQTIRILRSPRGVPPRAPLGTAELSPLLVDSKGNSYRIVCGDSHYPVEILECGHSICRTCWVQMTTKLYFRPSLNCPICRCRIRETISPAAVTPHRSPLMNPAISLLPIASPALAPAVWPDFLSSDHRPTSVQSNHHFSEETPLLVV